MQVTIQAKIKQENKFLDDLGEYISSLRGKLLKDLLKKEENLNDLKARYIKEHGLLARQFNSLANEVKGLIKSAQELHKLNIKNAKKRKKTLEKKIKNQKKKLEKVETVERQGKKSEKEHFRFVIHQKKRKLRKQEDRLKKLEQKKESICLGSKKLFGKQHQLKENGYKSHQEWLTDFRGQRTNRIFFLGSKDETFGNQNCQFLPKGLQVRVPRALEEKYGEYVVIPVKFTYGDDIIHYAISSKQAINYRFCRKEKGWYLFLTTKRKPVKKNTRKKLGAIGIHLNKDHLAWAEINQHGNLIKFGKIPTPVENKSSEQRKAIYGDAIKKIIEYAHQQQKPVVIEKLNFAAKKNQFELYSSGYRRMLSNFAYKKFHSMILSKAYLFGVQVIEVNPAYSSIIGKYKFSQNRGISVHIAAAFVLARRAFRFSERLPARSALWLTEYGHRHVWALWKSFSSSISSRNMQVVPRARLPLSLFGIECPLTCIGGETLPWF